MKQPISQAPPPIHALSDRRRKPRRQSRLRPKPFDILGSVDELGAVEAHDPCPENPFPPGSPDHQLWAQATAEAHNNMRDLTAQHLAAGHFRDLDSVPDYEAARLRIWCSRQLRFVRSEKEVQAFQSQCIAFARCRVVFLERVADEHGVSLPHLQLRDCLASVILKLRNEADVIVAGTSSRIDRVPVEAVSIEMPTAADPDGTVGGRLRQLRIESGLSQEDLAVLVELDKNTVARHERNEIRPRVATLGDYAAVFSTKLARDVSVRHLTGEPQKSLKSKRIPAV